MFRKTSTASVESRISAPAVHPSPSACRRTWYSSGTLHMSAITNLPRVGQASERKLRVLRAELEVEEEEELDTPDPESSYAVL